MQWIDEGEEDVSETKRFGWNKCNECGSVMTDAEREKAEKRCEACREQDHTALAQRHAAARKLVHDAIVIATDDEVIRLLNEAYTLLASEPTP